jgi:hypothetical protein
MCAERLKLENWTFIPYAILVLRFGTITGDVSSVINVIKIPGFILEDFTKRPWEGYLYLGFQIIMIYLFIRWIFAIPIMMEEDGTSFPQACRKSALMTKGTSVLRVGFVAIGWAALIWFFYYAGAAVIVAIWFLLSMWLLPGETEPFPVFFLNRFGPTGTIFYIFFLWIVTPLIAASFQSLYYIRKQEMSGEILPYTEAPHFFHRYPLLKWLIVAICAILAIVALGVSFALMTVKSAAAANLLGGVLTLERGEAFAGCRLTPTARAADADGNVTIDIYAQRLGTMLHFR